MESMESMESMETIGKEIDEFPDYTIYNNGTVYSKKSSKYMKPSLSSGYYSISIINKNNIKKKNRIHRLVAIAFVTNENPDKYTLVDHIDRDKLNNVHTNLRWANGTQNNNNSDLSKNHNVIVCQYTSDDKFIKEFSSMAEANRETNTSCDMIHKCCSLKCTKAKDINGVLYKWKYKNEKIKIKKPEGKILSNLSRYIILNDGQIYSIILSKYMNQSINADGYTKISLVDDKGDHKTYGTHRLVMLAYIGESELQVNHKNSIRNDNRLENLEYVTPTENRNHSLKYGLSKKCAKQVHQIDIMTLEIINTFSSLREAAKTVNVTHRSICSVCNNVRESSGGYKWKYVY